MPKTTMIATFLVLTLVLGPSATATGNGYDLFQKALVRERAEGNLEEAIQLYQRIAREFADDHALAAKALVQLGHCYEKLGNSEARKAYERVLREYGDEREAAAEARARLATLSRSTALRNGITTRQIWTGQKGDIIFGSISSVSSDGRYLSRVDWFTGNLALLDLATGKNRQLTNNPAWRDNEFALNSAISPDGKQVAYSWLDTESRFDLRLLSLTGNDPATPRILYTNDEVEDISPHAWSPDGKWIAVQLGRKDRTRQIGLVNAGDGAQRVLKSVDWRGSTRLFFSPDGKYLAFDLPSSDSSENRDVFVLAVDGSREVPAVIHPANDIAMGWTPDGGHLLFASDRSGSSSLWALAWADGKPQGDPELIKTDIGRARAIGLTRSGALYYGVTLGASDIYIAAIDANSGEVSSPPIRPIKHFVGQNESPDWSADGKYLAYISNLDPGLNRLSVLGIHSLETGQSRELRPKLSAFYGPHWAPDGRSLAVNGADNKGRWGIYRVDAQTGEVSPIVSRPGELFSYSPQWAPDGKKLFYRRTDTVRKDEVVVEHDLDSGSERELVRSESEKLLGASVSPNARLLAFALHDPAAKNSKLMIAPIEGGQARELLRLEEPVGFEWAADSRAMLVSKKLPTGDSEFWLTPLDGSQPRKVALNAQDIRGLTFHPKTNQVAFVAGGFKFEVWVIENFLPALQVSSSAR